MTLATIDAPPRRRSLTFDYQRLVNAVFAVFIFFGMLSLIEPSPYDFLAIVIIPLWAIGGFRVHRSLILIITLWLIFEAAGFFSLMPHLDDADAVRYQFQSLYLVVTVLFFMIFMSENTERRAELCLKAFTAGAIISALIGFVAYLNLFGLGPGLTTYEGRVSGSFKDPNVFGSYLILSAAYLLQRLLLPSKGGRFWSLIGLVIIVLGIFVSFSRGSWGATAGALFFVTASAFLTAADRRQRRRIVKMTGISILLGVLALGSMLSVPNIRSFFFERAELTKDYDEGVTGRFGNQIRSLPMLVERPEGFGPLQFRTYFDLEPHNSYIGGFANDGWLGGFAWIGIVLSSCFVAIRMMFKPSPYRQAAQVFGAAMIVLFAQGFQIDVDHWRQVFLCIGSVWGLEAARLKWAERMRQRIGVNASWTA